MNDFEHDNNTEVAVTNFALTLAKVLLVFAVIIIALISPPRTEDGVPKKAEFIITIDWPGDYNRSDVDIWIKTPDDGILFFKNKQVGFLTLERDDTGGGSDTILTDSGSTTININEETVTMRGIQPGEYIINVHLYKSIPEQLPVEVKVKILKLNPNIETVLNTNVILISDRQEIFVTRMTLSPKGNATFDRTLPVNIVPKDRL